MQYGEKKALEMARDGFARVMGAEGRPARLHQKAHIRAFLEGDEDADIYHDEYKQAFRGGYDRYVYGQRYLMRWANQVSLPEASPETRRMLVLKRVPRGVSRLRLRRQLRHMFPEELPRRAWSQENYQARVAREEERKVRLLKEIVESGWGHRLLNRNIRHRTVDWAIEEKPVVMASSLLSRNVAYVGETRFTHIRKGPTQARKLGGLGDVEDFLRDINQANRCPVVNVEPYTVREQCPARYFYWNSNAHRHTYVRESTQTTRTNPDYHPEWLESVDAFLNTWESAAGDVGEILQKYRWV